VNKITACNRKIFSLCWLIVSVIVIGSVCVMAEAAGNIYYVSPQGNDRNSGDKDNPFLTIQVAINRAGNGEPNNYDIVRVEKGVYITWPIYFSHNNQGLYIEEGTVIIAKSNKGFPFGKGPFSGTNACLFEAKGKKNISIRAYGATFQMNREEYEKLKGEWRTIIQLYGCTNIQILGATLKNSGGDGIDISGWKDKKYCENILIKDVICENNSRNAISIISVDGLIIENCILKNSNGKEPECGLDFEPNKNDEILKNIVVRNTTIQGNKGYALYIQSQLLKADANNPKIENIEMLFDGLHVKDGKGVYIAYLGDKGPDGSIVFKNMKVENTTFGTWIGKSSKKLTLTFENCIWKDINKGDYPISIFSNGENTNWPGGVQFNDCQIFDDQDRPAIRFFKYDKNTLYEVHGNLYVNNAKRKGSLYDWQGAEVVKVDMTVNQGIADFAKAHEPNSKE
jgi:hypothetical protein